MNLVLKPPSLEHRCLFKIVAILWNQKDVRALIAKCSFRYNFNPKDQEWKPIEERVMQKVPQLLLPQLLSEVVLGYMRAFGSQIYEWMKCHCIRFRLRVGLPAEFIWTAHGTIDRKRTAAVLVKDENLDLSTRYKLACLYCLEDAVIQLWNNMPRVLKESDWESECSIICFWSRTMKRGGFANEHTSYKDEFEKCAWDTSAASEYFLRKLTPLERKESLVTTAKGDGSYVRVAEVLCFLLSEMDEDQQMEVFKDEPIRVLKVFLQWPRQRFFMGVANCMWDFLSKINFEIILLDIAYKVRDGYKDWNYQNLFRQLWQESPNALKSSIADDDESWLLHPLIYVKDKENIRVILKDATLTAKQKLIYSVEVLRIFQDCIRDNDWDFIEFIIQECLPSKDERLKFKQVCEKPHWMYFRMHLPENRLKWEQLFRFSDDSVCRHEKRNAEEGESSSSKQFRNLE